MLPGGARIGESEGLIVEGGVVEEICVVHAGAGGVDVGLPPASVLLLKRMFLFGDLDADFLGVGRPKTKALHSAGLDDQS
jgi:hypothetical protein